MEVRAPVDLIRQMYLGGLSTRQVAQLTGYSASYIHKLCRPVIRDRRDALILRGPKIEDPDHWRTCRARARKVMEKHLGRKLGRFEYVHHKDEDYTNNDIDNLEVLSPKEHSRRHFPGWEVPRHERPARKAYMKSYNRRTIKAECVICGNEFMQDRYDRGETCSPGCKGKLIWRRRRASN